MSDRSVTAIDIALKPDQAMIRRARADNARLLKAYPEGFALDKTHHPHLTMIQQVRPHRRPRQGPRRRRARFSPRSG